MSSPADILKGAIVRTCSRLGLSLSRSPRRQLDLDLGWVGPIDVLIDVGVAQGTPELYLAAPDAFLLMIEPLEVFEPHIAKTLKRRPGEWLKFGVGSRAQLAEFVVCPDPRKSGRQPRSSSAVAENRVSVEIRTLDDLVGSHPRVLEARSIVLKIDCEGDELEALLGADALLGRVDVLIVEQGLLASKQAASPSEVVALASTKGLELFDVVAVGRVGGIAQHADLVFVRDRLSS